MKKKQLPTGERLALISRGQFFLNIALFKKANKGLIYDSGFLTRISRFFPKDFPQNINRNFTDYSKIYFADEFSFKKQDDFFYIERTRNFHQYNFQLLEDIVKSTSILVVDISYDEVKIYEYKDEVLSVKKQRTELNNLDSPELNSYVFDPQANLEKTEIDDAILKLIAEIKPKIGSFEVVVFTGEYVWTNNILELFSRFAENLSFQKLKVFIDQSAIFESLLTSKDSFSYLRLLERGVFIPDFVTLNNIPTNSKISTEDKDSIKREIFILKNKPIYLNTTNYKKILVDSSKSFDLSETKGLLINPMKNLNVMDPYKKHIKILLREDFKFEFIYTKTLFNVEKQQKCGVEIFNYRNSNAINHVNLDVINFENVKTNDRIARLKKVGNLMEKHFRAPVDGLVDLSFLKYGFIFVNKSKKMNKKIITKYQLKVHPRLIWGRGISGILGEEIKYVESLSVKKFKELLESGCTAIIASSIQRELFWDYTNFELYKICPLAVLDGIEVQTEANNIWKFLNSSPIKLDSERKEIIVGQQHKLTDTFSFANKQKPDKKIKKGDRVRIIDKNLWGEYATILDVDGENLKVQIGHKTLITNLLNII